MPGLEINLIVPDLWQQDAVRALRAGRDVVVHAPTGAGKTYIFELLYPVLRGQAVFTVPTRALANDKLAEWRSRGWDVGIATGDVALNPGARVIVATLETQKGSFLHRRGPRLLVVDEYQMIGDATRGVNYELALALAPPETQLLLLSGSVGNPHDVVDWLRRIGRDAVLISHGERPVPLDEIDLLSVPGADRIRSFWPRVIAKALQADLEPVLVFAPRRNASEELAHELDTVLQSMRPIPDPLPLSAEQELLAGPRLSKLLKHRIAYHHSGLSYAVRAGLIEPLAKAGHLRVVVATMGLASGINFSMRSVLVTDTRYFAGNFEQTVRPDELLQMFGRAGRRGLDEAGSVLTVPGQPRLCDARPRQLKRAIQVDWPSLISVMQNAAITPEISGKVPRPFPPFAAAVELTRSLFSTQKVPLGVEHSLETGPMPCDLWVDAERARLVRKGVVEMLNSANEWEPLREPQPVALGDLWVRENDRWVRALKLPRVFEKLGFGNLTRLGHGVYGREIPVAIIGNEGALSPVKWVRAKLRAEAREKQAGPTRTHTDLHGRARTDEPAGQAQDGRRSLRASASPRGPDAASNRRELLPGGRGAAASGAQKGKRANRSNKSAPPTPPFTRALLEERLPAWVAPGALHDLLQRGNQLVARVDFSALPATGVVDSRGRALAEPPTREDLSRSCRACAELDWCRAASLAVSPAFAWRRLGLVHPDGTPTTRGILFGFFNAGEGLAVAAAIEDESYPVDDLLFDLANLRAGPRFAGDEPVFSGRLGSLCQRVYERADYPGYLEMGVPVGYGVGASEVVRDVIDHPGTRHRLVNDLLRHGDIERALTEWISLLRHIAHAPEFESARWTALQNAARARVATAVPPHRLEFPPLLAVQSRRYERAVMR